MVGSDFGADLRNLAPRRSALASSLSRCLTGLSVLPQISHLLSTAGSVDTWKGRSYPTLHLHADKVVA